MRPLVVVGDALLDVDVEGTAGRLCPEAPVPVVDVDGEWLRPGGAGLAATLLATTVASGPEVLLVTALGADATADRFRWALSRDVTVLSLPSTGDTVRKTRVRAGGQTLLRVDDGGGRAAHGPLPAAVRRAVREAGAVLVSDYGRGLAAHPELRALLADPDRHGPVVWDPHPRGPAPVPGTTLATPNEAEARTFGSVPHTGDTDRDDGEPVARAARRLRRAWGCAATAVTTGARGAVVAVPARSGHHGADGNGNGAGDDTVVPVPVPPPSSVDPARGEPAPPPDTGTGTVRRPDTCGAGDRFAGAALAALAEGADVVPAVRSAVAAASRFVAAGGATTLSAPAPAPTDGHAAPAAPRAASATASEVADRVRARGGRLVATGGCFDLLHAGHVTLLRQARALGDALVVCLNSDASVRALKGPGRPVVAARDRARVLAELASVDAVLVFDEPDPAAVLDHLRPDVWVKGADHTLPAMPEAAVVRGYGGEVVLVPTVDGYSTTRLLQGANG